MPLWPIGRAATAIALSCALLAACAMTHAGKPRIRASGPNAESGKAIFSRECAACHGAEGIGGPVGPALRHETLRRSHKDIVRIITDPDPPMPKLYPGRLSRADLRNVSAYVETL